MKTKLQIIDETEAAYADPKNRATQSNGCLYITPDGRMCAVGRCCIAPASLNPSNYASTLFQDYRNEEFLKPEYRGHGVEFWGYLQDFHDRHSHFTTDGISEEGQHYLAQLRERYANH